MTLDGKTLNVRDIRETVKTVSAGWDAWENQAYVRKTKVYGAVKSWRLQCYEENVAWTDSNAKYFQEKAASGNSVAFVVSEGDMHSVNTNVYVLNVDLAYEGGVPASAKYRRFTLQLQEA